MFYLKGQVVRVNSDKKKKFKKKNKILNYLKMCEEISPPTACMLVIAVNNSPVSSTFKVFPCKISLASV